MTEKIIEEIMSIVEKDRLNEFFEGIDGSSKDLAFQITKIIKEKNYNLRNYMLNNTDVIIEMFQSIKNIEEDLIKCKRNFDANSNQAHILKKKFIDPFEKLTRNITYKYNIDSTIEAYETIKTLKDEIKIMKIYFENDKNSLVTESNSVFSSYRNIKKLLVEKESELTGINYITGDLQWFKSNEEKMLKTFRQKFHESVGKMVINIFYNQNKEMTQISKFLDFFSSISHNLLVAEVKDYSNGLLRDVMIDTFFKQIIQGKINTINQLDLISENIVNIRKDLRNFFQDLEKYTKIMKNLSFIIKHDFDKHNLVIYDEIMEIVYIYLIVYANRKDSKVYMTYL